MKLIFSTLLILLISLKLHADPGPAYIFNIEVTYDKGKAIGFVWIGSGYIENEKQIFSNDNLFADFIKKWNNKDSIYLYQNMYFIDSLNADIYFNDKLLKIDEKKISGIKLRKVLERGFGNWISEDRFETKDLVWLKKPYIRKEVYGDYNCGYNIYFFENVPPNKEFINNSKKYWDYKNNSYIINTLSPDSDNDSEWNSILTKYFKYLKKYKVIVQWVDCSC